MAKVAQSTPYTASEAVRALGRQIRSKSSGVAASGARKVSGRQAQIDRAVDEVQDGQIRRR